MGKHSLQFGGQVYQNQFACTFPNVNDINFPTIGLQWQITSFRFIA